MKPDIDVELLEGAINDMLPGLTMYVRDVNLSPVCAARYVPGTIIREPGFTDASSRVMGMVTTHRIAILSNHMADLSEYEHGTNWGLFVANRGAHFKVLDVYAYGGKTQILLLHLLDDERWKLFETVTLNLEAQLIADCRQRFESKSQQPPVKELTTQAWLQRCADPIGMNETGKLFALEPASEA